MLRQREYQVWMDVDNMKGSTLEAMADAIEKSAVVLICMSQRYKESTNCRTGKLFPLNNFHIMPLYVVCCILPLMNQINTDKRNYASVAL